MQAILLWLRVTLAEVKIDLGSHILLPQGTKIPIQADGTLLISPNAGRKARRVTMNELALATQQHEAGEKAADFETMRNQIILARTSTNPLSPPDVFAATLATIQTNSYVRRVSWIFDCVFLLVACLALVKLSHLSRVDLFLTAIAFTAAYCMIALAVVSRWLIWLPGCLPLGAVWLFILIIIVLPARFRRKRPRTPSAPPIPAIPPPVL